MWSEEALTPSVCVRLESLLGLSLQASYMAECAAASRFFLLRSPPKLLSPHPLHLSTSSSTRSLTIVAAAAPRSQSRPQRVSTTSFKASTRPSKNSRKKEEDSWEALFDQLEKDLENGTGVDDSKEITEEQVARLEQELGAITSHLTSNVNDPKLDHFIQEKSNIETRIETQQSNKCNGLDGSDKDEDDYEEEIRLETWQLRKLAAALRVGRRRANIKRLSEEVGLDRADVLAFLKNPPLDLLTISALQEPTEEKRGGLQSDKTSLEAHAQNQMGSDDVQKQDKVDRFTDASVVRNPRSWMGKKRIKKVHLETFELVYKRTKRPTNTMIENLVHLTNVPRKRIVEWFNNRRLQSASVSSCWFGH